MTSDDTINVADADSFMGEGDQAQLNATLEAGLAAGGGEVEFSVTQEGNLSLSVDSLGIDDTYNIFDYLS